MNSVKKLAVTFYVPFQESNGDNVLLNFNKFQQKHKTPTFVFKRPACVYSSTKNLPNFAIPGNFRIG